MTIEKYEGAKAIVIRDYNDAYKFAQAACKSNIVPAHYRSHPEDAVMAVMYGAEIGMPPMTSLQKIIMVKGQVTLSSEAILALVLKSGLLKELEQTYEGEEGTDNYRAVVKIVRKDMNISVVRSFSLGAAKRAGLYREGSPWKAYPERMLLHRARTFAIRDIFADILGGVQYASEELAEEAINEALVISSSPLDSATDKNEKSSEVSTVSNSILPKDFTKVESSPAEEDSSGGKTELEELEEMFV
jgi:hypothetical protein